MQAMLLKPALALPSTQAGAQGAQCSRHVPVARLLQALLVEKVTSALTLPKDASNREQAFQEVKDKGEAWVAKYRKGGGFQGRPSFR